jgi:type III restriction enzyme
MITLKAYQDRVLTSLRDFFRQCAEGRHPADAFQAIRYRNNQPMQPYLPVPVPVPVPGLPPEMPYICLRVPTGGGKTLLACRAAGIAMTDFRHATEAIVLWLVPHTTILDQTASALKRKDHPYRQALDLCGSVEVKRITEALYLSRATADNKTVVIVATIQAFRAEDPSERLVYKPNGALEDHFNGRDTTRLLPGPDGNPLPSLVNVLRLRQPIIIVDEAHNARTDLSFAALGDVLPSCIIEFTATPDRTQAPSNVLHYVSAAELKAEDMIKLPLRVFTRHPSQREQLLADAVACRADLEKLAIQEGELTNEYLRPIMLIQAERVDACEDLRQHLTTDYGIPADQVKISVGVQDELKGLSNIMTRESRVRFIITVEKLREGWDCPFAYVLCSLKETRSATAIEQIVGRILRLPNAKAKQHPELNCSYAFSVSPSLSEVLAEFRNALESNGFTAAEADRLVIPSQQGALPLGRQPRTVQLTPLDINAGAIPNHLSEKVHIDLAKGTVTILAPLDESETAQLAGCLTSSDAKDKVHEAIRIVREADQAFGGNGRRGRSGYERNIDFIVPMLCIQENGDLLEFEGTVLLEHPWRLSAKDATLPESYNPLTRPAGGSGTLNVGDRGNVQILPGDGEANFVNQLHQQVLALSLPEDWSQERLIAWIDQHIEHEDIPEGESGAFLQRVIQGILTRYGISVNILALDRFRLRNEVDKRIQQHREQERKAAFQLLLQDNSKLTVSPERTVNFRTIAYDPSSLYEGSFEFRKHYYGAKPGELIEYTQDNKLTEEFQCAQFIDNLDAVEFWFRNLPRKTSSFRLQTSTDWFYPDFCCKLKDGRVLVIEYKGKHLYDQIDAAEKRAIGAVWESRSNGQCLFVMPTDVNFSSITAKIAQH